MTPIGSTSSNIRRAIGFMVALLLPQRSDRTPSSIWTVSGRRSHRTATSSLRRDPPSEHLCATRSPRDSSACNPPCVTEDHFAGEVAAHYDDMLGAMGWPEVLGP